jgi:hypothetical protein
MLHQFTSVGAGAGGAWVSGGKDPGALAAGRRGNANQGSGASDRWAMAEAVVGERAGPGRWGPVGKETINLSKFDF